jgi:hypothetical protein
MPYTSISGRPERASRTGHADAVVKALADRADFYIPAEHVRDLAWLSDRVRTKEQVTAPPGSAPIRSVLAIDGSEMAVSVRDGLPSVRYGYAQTGAAYLDLGAMEAQRAERFVDPVALTTAVSTALVSLDLPTAGAYTREGISIQDSWREALDHIFRAKKIEVNRLNQSLMDLLMLLHGRPGEPAQSVPVTCPHAACRHPDVPVPAAGRLCANCSTHLYPTDVLRIHEEVLEDGTNMSALGRLMQVVELLVLIGLTTLLWEQARADLMPTTLFILDGPLAVYGPPAKLRARALAYVQRMSMTTPGGGPYICGIEKTGTMVDYARALARHDAIKPGELLVADTTVIAAMTNASNPLGYGAETYWGRKFVYRALDGRVVVPTIPPRAGAPYDDHGGQSDPSRYPTLAAILDVIDRTGSSMYQDGLIPVALAHGKAAFPIGVGTDVLKLVARHKLGLGPTSAASVSRPDNGHGK